MAAEADGRIVIDTKLDVSDVEKELAKIKKKIFELELNKTTKETVINRLAEQAAKLGGKLDAAKAKLEELRLSETPIDAMALESQQATVERLQLEYDRVDISLEKQQLSLADINEKIDEQKTKYEACAQAQQNVTVDTEKMASAAKRVNNTTRSFSRRLINLAASAFVFSLISKGFNSIKDSMTKSLKANTQYTEQLAKLKGAWLAAFQPIYNFVVPAINVLLRALTAVGTMLGQLFSFISGTSYEETKNNAESLYDEANAIEQTGSAAKSASKSLAAFDEINQLSNGASSGGNGSSSTTTLPNFDLDSLPSWLEKLTTSLKLAIDDVLFEWKDLTGEQIAEKAIAALAGICGAVVGFTIGGVPGAIIGTLLGVCVGLVIDALTFDHDGKISGEEILSMLIIAIGGIAGGIIGFKLGGIKGAAIGALIGMSATAIISSLTFDHDGKISRSELQKMLCTALIGIFGGAIGFAIGGITGAIIGATIGVALSLLIEQVHLSNQQKILDNFYATDAGKELQALIEQVASDQQLSIDLTARINSITGEIDSATMADFTMAQQLIDNIFEIDSKDNKTSKELEILKEQINTLNSLGLDGITVEFDDLTGKVITSRGEIEKTMDALLQQYQFEALREAYIEAYRAQYDAQNALNEASETYTALLEKQEEQQKKVEEAQEELNNAFAEYDKYVNKVYGIDDGSDNGTGQALAFLDDKYNKLSEAVSKATKKLNEQKLITDEVNTAVNDAETNLDALSENYEKAKAKVEEITTTLTGFTDNSNVSKEAVEETTKAVEEFTNSIDDAAASTEQGGAAMILGLITGMAGKAGEASEMMKSIINNLISTAETGLNRSIEAFNQTVNELKGQGALVGSAVGGLRSLSLVNLPRLAQGAVIPPNREFMAVLGDQKSGTNIETPLATMVQAFRQALSEDGGGQTINLTVTLDGEVIYQNQKKVSRRHGMDLAGGRA